MASRSYVNRSATGRAEPTSKSASALNLAAAILFARDCEDRTLSRGGASGGSNLPRDDGDVASHTKHAWDRNREGEFNPAGPRNRGEWSKAGGGSASSHVEYVQYRGYFHDFMLNDLLRSLTSHGAVAIKNVPVLG